MLRKAVARVWAAGAWVTSRKEPAPGRLVRGEPTPGGHRHLDAGPLLLSSHDGSCRLVSAPLVLPSGGPRGDRLQPGAANLVYLLLMR
jgi:hypothetical protein